MDLSSFYQKCVHITIVMFIFILLFNFILGLNVFSTSANTGTQTSGNNSDFLQATKTAQYTGGFVMDNLWSIVLLGVSGGIAIAILLQSTAILGVYLFCYVFWAAYLNLLSILSSLSYLGSIWGFVTIGTGIMIFVFIAAVIGMLTNAG